MIIKGERLFVIVLICVILFNFTSALTAKISNYSIESSYFGGDIIKGNVNISFSGQSSSTIITSNFNGSIDLLSLLLNNSYTIGNQFNCSINNCQEAFTIEGNSINSIQLNAGETKIIGFLVKGNEDVSVSSVTLGISSDVESSCYNQLGLDILGKNEKFLPNYNYINDSPCNEKVFGCFDSKLKSNQYEIAEITTDEYCNKVDLDQAPAYWAGANLVNSQNENATLQMTLYSEDWNELGNCNLPRIINSTQEVKCLIDYPTSSGGNYYICISKTGSENANYKIKMEQTGKVCGVSNTGSEEYDWDYDLFISNAKYDQINIILNGTNFEKYNNGYELSDYINEYLYEKYYNKCPEPNGCVVPIKLHSYSDQKITFYNPEIKYRSGNPLISKSELYLIKSINSTINSDYLILDLSKANFQIPITTNIKKFELYFDDEKKISIPIDITNSFNFDLQPTNALIGVETQFNIISNAKVVSSTWDFGDGSNIENSQQGIVSHKYLTEGTYEISVEVTRDDGVSAKRTFKIITGDIRKSVSELIYKYNNRINLLKSQIQKYDPWVQDKISEHINISAYSNILALINNEYTEYNATGNLSDVLSELISLDIPESINEPVNGRLPLATGLNSIDVNYIKQITDDKVSWDDKNKELIKQKIIDWNINNYNSLADFKIIYQKKDNQLEPILSYYKINVNKKADSNYSEDGILIINYPNSQISFKQDYGSSEINNELTLGTVINVSGDEVIEFILPARVNLDELSSYIAPKSIAKELGVIEENTPPREIPNRPYWLYFILILAFFIIYILLQQWYKKRYEKFLFQNRDDLYNLVNFIHNSRLSGNKDNITRNNLLKNKWKNEQIEYAIKKLDGKRTGMFEIPVFKIFEKIKIKKEIEKRNPNMQNNSSDLGGVRFIKRPN